LGNQLFLDWSTSGSYDSSKRAEGACSKAQHEVVRVETERREWERKRDPRDAPAHRRSILLSASNVNGTIGAHASHVASIF
jgi:hypothetical protein